MTVKCPRSAYTLTLDRLFHFGTKRALAVDRKIGNGTKDVCQMLPDPNCISNTNYTENVTRIQNTF